MTRMQLLYLVVPLAPLVAAIVAGLFGRRSAARGAHWVTILARRRSRSSRSCVIFADVLAGNTFNGDVYTWLHVRRHAIRRSAS